MIAEPPQSSGTDTAAAARRAAGRLVGGVLVASLSAWVGLVAALFGLHAFAPTRLPVVDFVVPDPALGWRHGADLDLLFYDEERVARILTSAAGFRIGGESVPDSTAHTDLALAVLGDSFTFAGQVHWPQTFPALVGDRVAACRGQQVRVHNFGVAGYGAVQEWQLYRGAVAPLAADLVLVAFFGNDVADDLPPGSERSRAALDGAGRPWAVTDVAGIPQPVGPDPGEGFRVAQPLRVVVGTARRAADRLWMAFSDVTHPAAATLAASGLAAATDSTSPEGRRLGVTEPPPGWSVTAAVLKALLAEIAAAGSQAVLVHIGHPAAVERGLAHPFVDESLTAAVATEAGALFVPLESAFRRYRHATGDALHLLGGMGHWNERGHALAAELIGRALCDSDASQNPVPSPR
jgi:hypothetical protein